MSWGGGGEGVLRGEVGGVWPAPPPPRVLLQRRGEGGGGEGGGGEGGGGSRGEGSPPPAEMNHIHQELQKCTTLTHSAYIFVIMSEDR